MPAMSDVTVDPYQQNETDLSHVGPQSDPAVWNDTAIQSESQNESFSVPDFNTLNFDSLPSLDSSTQNDCSYLGPVSGGPQSTTTADFSFQQDVKDPAAVAGCTGICNLGNTCFMSSGLQCLVSNAALITHFLEEFQPESNDVFFSSLTGQFALLIQKVWSGQYSMLYPAKFKAILGIYHPQFKDYRQHDCQEFLALLMDSLHEQLNITSPLDKKAYDSGEESSQSENEEVWSGENNQLEAISAGKLVGVTSHQNDVSSVAGQSEDSRLAEAILAQSLIASDDSLQSENSSHSMRSIDVPQCDENAQQPAAQFQMPNNLTQSLHASEENMESVGMQGSLTSFRSGFIENIQTHTSSVTEPAEAGSEQMDGCGDQHMPTVLTDCMEVEESREESSDERRLPSLEDLYMKDTKTLNTNVLSSELIEEINMAVDSEKFHKVENTNLTSETQSQFDLEHLNDLLTLDPTKGNGSKPIKETNLLAKVKDKFPEDGYPKKLLFSEMAEDESYSINNIKRFKTDDDEKNLKMQQRMKVNTDKNPTKPVNVESRINLPECSVGMVLSPRGRHWPSQGVPQTVQNLPPNGRYLRMADKAWQRHLTQNRSIIVDTFHGQFKSTVVCSECHHVSLTFEPFMYLSVPLPHAMERQISVIFIPSDNKQPIRYLVTLNKQDSVKTLKHHLTTMIGEESCDMIVAEVLDNHIARILEDHTLLRYVNDLNRTVYAFEMLPAPDINNTVDDDVPGSGEDKLASAGTDSMKMPPNNITFSSSKADADPLKSTLSGDADSNPRGSNPLGSDLELCNGLCAENSEEQGKLNNSMYHSFNQAWPSEELHHNFEYQHNPLSCAGSNNEYDVLTDNAHSGNPVEDPSAGGNVANSDCVDQSGKSNEEEGGSNDGPTAADQWKTCAICLEEMIDSNLMTHASCGGTLCHTCLEMTFKHYGEAGLSCPVCSTPVDPAVDFIQLNDMADYKPKTRILSVPVVHRLDTVSPDDKVRSQLFGHPNMLYLPSNMTAEFLYGSVDRVVQCLANYVVILTDGQGLRCSRCLYTQHCSGCQLPREGEISLHPGDHLAIKFTDLSDEQMDSTQKVIDHESMENLRPDETLSLSDCFEAFTQSEVLDEHNPWYCPICKHNRCANKTMTVWKYPNTLVVYLKRFVFHELSSTKIDCKVAFPLEALDLSNFISGPTKDCLKYDLQSCVCHFGGVNSGHYTSYAKHPVSGNWVYYNDETVTHKEPSQDDYNTAYVLFYQRQGTSKDFHLPERLPVLPDLPEFPPSELSTGFPSSPISTDYISASSQPVANGSSQDKEVAPPDGAKNSLINACSNYDFYS